MADLVSTVTQLNESENSAFSAILKEVMNKIPVVETNQRHIKHTADQDYQLYESENYSSAATLNNILNKLNVLESNNLTYVWYQHNG